MDILLLIGFLIISWFIYRMIMVLVDYMLHLNNNNEEFK